MTINTPAFRTTCLLFALFCTGSAPAMEQLQGVPKVVTTNPILQDIVRHVGGDLVSVSCLLPPGIDIHSFDPTPATVRSLVEADLLVINGYGLETRLEPILENANFAGPIAVAASTSRLITIDPDGSGHDGEAHDHGPIDPHAWHDLRNAISYAEVIHDALVEINPGAADTYDRLTDLYVRELRNLDTWTRRLLLPLPENNRSFLVSHQGLAYLGRAYGLNIVTVVGLSPHQDPDARQIGTIINHLRAHDIRAIFVEAGANPGIIRQISRESGIPISDELYTGTLGVGNELSATFTGMFRLNVIRIVRALDPDAATGPEQDPS